MSDARPLGVFDSGVGGLTVLREIIRRSPAESTVYLGDNARAPYGVRSDAEVLDFSIQSLDLLAERDVKAIVVACNTSTAVALGALRRRYDLPILGVIRPGAALPPPALWRDPPRRFGRGPRDPHRGGRGDRAPRHDSLARVFRGHKG